MINSFNKLWGKGENNNNSTRVEFNFSFNETKDGLIVNGIKKSSTIEEKIIIPPIALFDGKTYPITVIGKKAFYGEKMTSVTIPNSVQSIEDSAFSHCENLTSVTIPDGVRVISDWAFEYCISLSDVVFPDSLIVLGKCAFAVCSELYSIDIPNSIKTIEQSTFAGCGKLSNVVIGKSVSEIKNSAFYNCSSLTCIVIPNNIKTIGGHAFEGTSLTNIKIPNSVTSIGEYAFFHCRKLTEVEVGSSLKKIAESAFYGCPVLNKRSVEKIEKAIEVCSLKSRVVPEVLNNAFHANGIMPGTVLEVVWHIRYLTQSGKQEDYTEDSSVLKENFSSMIHFDMIDQVEDCSLTIHYKKEDHLATLALVLKRKEELLEVLLWIKNSLFKGKMKGKHELSAWFQKKKQEELADYVAGDTIDINDFKYPLRVSKAVASYKDIKKTVSGFSDLYNEKGYEISKRGYRVPTLEEWIHFANSIEGRSILERQYNDKDAYEVCMADAKTVLHVNVKSHKLAILDFEYRRTHPGPLRNGFYRYVQSPIPETDLFPEGYVNREAARLWGEAEAEYEEYLERREPWDC